MIFNQNKYTVSFKLLHQNSLRKVFINIKRTDCVHSQVWILPLLSCSPPILPPSLSSSVLTKTLYIQKTNSTLIVIIKPKLGKPLYQWSYKNGLNTLQMYPKVTISFLHVFFFYSTLATTSRHISGETYLPETVLHHQE